MARHGVGVELGKTLVSIEQDADSVTAMVSTKGPDGDELHESIAAQYLVCSDGAKGKSCGIQVIDAELPM